MPKDKEKESSRSAEQEHATLAGKYTDNYVPKRWDETTISPKANSV